MKGGEEEQKGETERRGGEGRFMVWRKGNEGREEKVMEGERKEEWRRR